ncbi:unnamed protein product [Rotaria sp. Silwood1]|nr:unnamed protein product [Rotaria sp. Silwood1]CAF1326742.1 unnamed protein product [Rotaria sp. Silwood1]
MASKQILSSIRKNQNLCEISNEYPSLIRCVTPRHLCTCVKQKISGKTHIDELSNKEIDQHSKQNEKDSKENSKNAKEQIESIELFQQEEINDKLYKKRRYQLRRTKDYDDDKEKDNTNE